MGLGNKAFDYSYLTTWLVREAQIRDRGYVTCGRYKGTWGAGPRQPPLRHTPNICIDIYTQAVQGFCMWVRIYHLSESLEQGPSFLMDGH